MSDIVNLKISQNEINNLNDIIKATPEYKLGKSIIEDAKNKHDVRELKKDISSMKKDMLKMIDAIEMNEMHIKQLNWKLNKIKGERK